MVVFKMLIIFLNSLMTSVHYRNAIHLSKSVCFHCMVRVTNFLMGRYTANIYNQITIMSETLQPGYYNLVIVVLLTIVLVVKVKSNLVVDYSFPAIRSNKQNG